MNLEQIYLVAEIIAAFAVVISLLYLGKQLKSTRVHAQNQANNLITKETGCYTFNISHQR